MSELFAQLQTPSWWVGAIISGVVGNVATMVLVRLCPRTLASVARAMLFFFLFSATFAMGWCALTRPGNFVLLFLDLPPYWVLDRVVCPCFGGFLTIVFLGNLALYGSARQQLAGVVSITCVVSLFAYLLYTDYTNASIPLDRFMWLALQVYAWLIALIAFTIFLLAQTIEAFTLTHHTQQCETKA